MVVTFHPCSERPKEFDEFNDLEITAKAAESACEFVREQIKKENKYINPAIEFDLAAQAKDHEKLLNLMNSAWFGMPESTGCWEYPAFGILCDLCSECWVFEEPEPNSKENDCIPIVDNKVDNFGGKRILGWQIWKSGYMIEAELHAVWESPDGDLRDITPKIIPIKQILFVEDETLVYDGRQVNNVRLNITNNKLVEDFIEACNYDFLAQNKGKLAIFHGALTADIMGEDRFRNLLAIRELKTGIDEMLRKNETRDGLCFCNSGRKFKNCHGKNIKKDYQP